MNNNKGSCRFSKVAVLFGGTSREREISILSGRAVGDALKSTGLAVEEIDVGVDIRTRLQTTQAEAVFIALHGTGGEDGTIQKVLESIQIPYAGSGPEASRKAFYKDESKRIFLKSKIPTPDFQVIRNIGGEEKLSIKGPWVVKPVAEGSSIGVSMLSDEALLKEHVRSRLAEGEELLVETRIFGRELTVGILGECALPVIELRTKRPFYDFEAKYSAGLTEYFVPAPLDENIAEEISHCALHVHHALGLEGFSRVDILLDRANHPWVLEANSIPGFTDKSLLPKAARCVGIDFTTLCVNILNNASLKNQKKKNLEYRSVLKTAVS